MSVYLPCLFDSEVLPDHIHHRTHYLPLGHRIESQVLNDLQQYLKAETLDFINEYLQLIESGDDVILAGGMQEAVLLLGSVEGEVSLVDLNVVVGQYLGHLSGLEPHGVTREQDGLTRQEGVAVVQVLLLQHLPVQTLQDHLLVGYDVVTPVLEVPLLDQFLDGRGFVVYFYLFGRYQQGRTG